MPSCHGPRVPWPRLELADVFRAHGEAYRKSHVLSPAQARVMRAIETCRTAVLGGHMDECVSCHFERPAYNSCRNRHCPKCQALVQARWVERRLQRILPVPYFHVVFTLPAELRSLVGHNRRLLFSLLFRAAADTLLELGHDPRWLGAKLGFTAVLHTWTRDLQFHVHLHCIVTGGGVDADGRWKAVRGGGRFFIRVEVMGRLFRGKFLDALRHMHRDGLLRFGGQCLVLVQQDVFAAWIDRLWRKEWLVYAKRPFAGPEQVYRYLGLYTHRVGIANSRLLSMDDHGVTFATKDGKTANLPPHVFIHRYLQHVLPPGFVKIRHYGLLAATNLEQLQAAQRDLAPTVDSPLDLEPIEPTASAEDWKLRYLQLTGIDLDVCPRCGGRMQRRLLAARPRAPPSPEHAPHGAIA